MKLEFSRHIFEKEFNIKFHENPSGGSGVFPCGRTGGQTQMTKRIVHFCNFVNAPKNWTVNICFIVFILIYFTFNNKKQTNLRMNQKRQN